MNFQQLEVVHVKFCYDNTMIPMGRLALKDRKIFFEYTSSFLGSGLEVSPFILPLKPGVVACEDRTFDGLFGIFNDSLPDGWGRLLIDRKLMQMGINPGALTPLDRLLYVGKRGMGALHYEPEFTTSSGLKKMDNLDLVAERCLQFQEHDTDQFVDDLLHMNGSSAGARPKVLISIIQDNNEYQTNQNTLNVPHNDWIVKFPSSQDPKDIGPIEYAYQLMAKEAGLDVPEARLFKSKSCGGYFGVKRFDREKSTFLHMHTVSGLLHVDHRIPSLDYETLLKTTLSLTKNTFECERQFRNAVFNILAHNRDDHAKNFSFLMSSNGTWRVSPAYDLTFSNGPAGEHCTLIMGEGKNPDISHLIKLAEIAEISQETATEIIDKVKAAVVKWVHFSEQAGVSKKSSNTIKIALDRILKNIL